MCQVSESRSGRTQPAPRKPGNRSARPMPARTQLTISASWPGSRCRVMETVTGAEDMPEMVRGEAARRKSRWQSDPMPETPEELYARTTAAAGPDGRLPAPPVTEWPSFPWDATDGRVVPKPLAEPVEMEEPREGEVETRPCPVCTRGPEHVIWENERWTVSPRGRPTGLPVVLLLEPKDHLDYPDLNDTEAAEFGRVSARLCRVMSHLP